MNCIGVQSVRLLCNLPKHRGHPHRCVRPIPHVWAYLTKLRHTSHAWGLPHIVVSWVLLWLTWVNLAHPR